MINLTMQIGGVILRIVMDLRVFSFVAEGDEKLIASLYPIILPGYFQLVIGVMHRIVLRGGSTTLTIQSTCMRYHHLLYSSIFFWRSPVVMTVGSCAGMVLANLLLSFLVSDDSED